MVTLRLSIDPRAMQCLAGLPADSALRTAAEILRRGGTVALATETVYGLGANALQAEAVARIFTAKQRPAWDPLIVHIADESMLPEVVASVPKAARMLIDSFWPGPLTLLMPRHPDIPDAVTAGRPRVGVRMPSDPVARALIRAAGVPIAAPSANTFGHVSPTTAAHVAEDLDGRIDAILDSGETQHGLESTVVDACAELPEDPCTLYRPGAITIEQLRIVWPSTQAYVDSPSGQALSLGAEPSSRPSPGLGLRHYAPRAGLVLVESADQLSAALAALQAQHKRIGVMLPDGFAESLNQASAVIYRWGAWSDVAELAHRLFAGLRSLDDQGVEVIVCPLPAPEGLGVAVIDRLQKAARRA